MSKLKHVLELEQPNISVSNQELIRGTTTHTCNVCRTWTSTDEDISNCPRCHGTGQVVPVITIEWVSHGTKRNNGQGL